MRKNHTQWLRLQAQGLVVCQALQAEGYQILKSRPTLHWLLKKDGQPDYLLCWLPQPISAWSLLPNDLSEARSQLVELIHQTLAQSSYQPLFPVEHHEQSQLRPRTFRLYPRQISQCAYR